jgi:hypothetical protein
MKVKGVNTSWVWARVVVFSLFFAATLLLVGCTAGANRGSLQRDRDLDNQFLRYEVVEDHNYYFSGGYDKPNAILGIHKDYELVSDLWQPVQISSAQLEKWIRFIAPESYRGTGGYFAAYILNPEGKRVGFWYSVQSTTTIKFLEGNKIEVYTPELQQHKPEPILLRSRGRL